MRKVQKIGGLDQLGSEARLRGIMWKSSVVPSEPWTGSAAAFLGFAKCCSAGPQRIRKGAVTNRRFDAWQEHMSSSDNTAARGVDRLAAAPVGAASYSGAASDRRATAQERPIGNGRAALRRSV